MLNFWNESRDIPYPTARLFTINPIANMCRQTSQMRHAIKSKINSALFVQNLRLSKIKIRWNNFLTWTFYFLDLQLLVNCKAMYCSSEHSKPVSLWKRQGQLLEMQLLESRLLDTFFRNLDCSTKKCHLLNRKKYAVRVPRVNFKQLMKKSCRACRAVDTQFFATVK